LSSDFDSEKKIENRLIFGEVMMCTKNGAIFWPTLYRTLRTFDTAGITCFYNGRNFAF